MKTIRQISIYDRNIGDRYYVTDSGTFYTHVKNNKVMKNLDQRTITKHQIKEAMSLGKDWYVPFEDWGMYCIVLPNGFVLRRLKTTIRKDCNSVLIHMNSVSGKELTLYAARVVANTYIDCVVGKEVHHIDSDRTNNSVENLEVLTFEEHRGKGQHSHRHQL